MNLNTSLKVGFVTLVFLLANVEAILASNASALLALGFIFLTLSNVFYLATTFTSTNNLF